MNSMNKLNVPEIERFYRAIIQFRGMQQSDDILIHETRMYAPGSKGEMRATKALRPKVGKALQSLSRLVSGSLPEGEISLVRFCGCGIDDTQGRPFTKACVTYYRLVFIPSEPK